MGKWFKIKRANVHLGMKALGQRLGDLFGGPGLHRLVLKQKQDDAEQKQYPQHNPKRYFQYFFNNFVPNKLKLKGKIQKAINCFTF